MGLEDTLRRAASGDREAQDAIVRDFYGRVRIMVHRQLELDFRRRHRWMLAVFSTGDVVQDVFVGVVRHLESTDIADEDAFVGYLATLVRHRIMDTVRHHEAARRDNRRHAAQREDDGGTPREIADADHSPSVAAGLLEHMGIVQDVLGGFGPRERSLLELRLIEEKAFPEIADALGFDSAKAARSAFLRAQARMLVELRERGLRGDGSRS